MHLVLSGFMAAGKTTLGRAAAARAGVPFVDTDVALLEAARATSVSRVAPATVAEAFTSLGEPAFRALEATVLAAALASNTKSVIAVGGGALLPDSTRRSVLASHRVVTLTASPRTLLARATAPGAPTRPLLAFAEGAESAPESALESAPESAPESALEPAPEFALESAPESPLESPKTPSPEASLLDRIASLLARRSPVYAEAHATIPTDDGRSPDDLVTAILRAWESPALVVPLGARAYPVRFATAEGPAPLLADLLAPLRPTSWFHVTDTTVEPLHGRTLLHGLPPPAATVALRPGEREKHLGAVQQLLTALVEAGADRGSVLVAHGGGVVNDLTGFAAAILLRGVRWISVPTTLLSMSDASIGGKTGVDVAHAKNAAGAFHQPSAVLIDVRQVATETPRAFCSGLAEIAKSAAIADPLLFALLEEAAQSGGDAHPWARARGSAPARAPAPPRSLSSFAMGGEPFRHQEQDPFRHRKGEHLRQDLAFFEQAVFRSAAVKARIVAEDERETGARALLNFGHTLGHALEAAGDFDRWTHGEAVALGMIAAARAGLALGLTPPAVADRLTALLEALGLPTELRRADVEAALPYLSLDKKRRGTTVRAVFLTDIGQATLHDLPLPDLARLFTEAADGRSAG